MTSRLANAGERPARSHRRDVVFLDQRDRMTLAREFSGCSGAGDAAAYDNDAKHARLYFHVQMPAGW